MTAGGQWPMGDAEREAAAAALQLRLAAGRRVLARVAFAAAALSGAALAGVILLAGALAGHGSLLIAGLVLLSVPVAVVAVLAGALVWLGRRAWRSGAWLEAVPAAAGVPWAGRAARLLLVSRMFAKVAGQAGRPSRRSRRPGKRAPSRQATAWYQDEPGGQWHQARVDAGGPAR